MPCVQMYGVGKSVIRRGMGNRPPGGHGLSEIWDFGNFPMWERLQYAVMPFGAWPVVM